jgi:trk system potassium uptake protein TrkH
MEYPDAPQPRRFAAMAMNLLLGLCGLAAIAVLVLLHGFNSLPWPTHDVPINIGKLRFLFTSHEAMMLAEYAIATWLVLDRVLRLVLASRREEYLRGNWIDYAMIVITAFAMPFSRRHVGAEVPTDTLAQGIVEVYIVFAILRGLNLRFLRAIHPAALVGGGFVVLILIGTGLLMLPAAVPENSPGIFFVDALFTATGAVCATCLAIRDTARDFTTFGQAVILCMVQIGGFGFMLLGTWLAVRVGRKLTAANSPVTYSHAASSKVDLAALAWPIVTVMLVLEAIGAAAMFGMFQGNWTNDAPDMGWGQAIWHSVFHSVSAFCNAGFSLYTDSLSGFRDDWQVLGVMMPLIILGGLGFGVLQELGAAVGRLCRRLTSPGSAPTIARPWLSAHCQTVLGSSVMLILFGALVFMLVENLALNKNLVEKAQIKSGDYVVVAAWPTNPGEQLRESLVQSVSARSAGFRTLDIQQLSDAGKMTLCGLMLVGGSPGGTAGGVKTTVLVLLIAVAVAGLRGRAGEYGRIVAPRLAQKTVAMASIYLLLVALVTMLLCVATGSRGKFMDCLFESCSACGSVGLSTGLTPTLGVLGKSTLIGGMLLGRLGPLLLLMALTSGLGVAESEEEVSPLVGGREFDGV